MKRWKSGDINSYNVPAHTSWLEMLWNAIPYITSLGTCPTKSWVWWMKFASSGSCERKTAVKAQFEDTARQFPTWSQCPWQRQGLTILKAPSEHKPRVWLQKWCLSEQDDNWFQELIQSNLSLHEPSVTHQLGRSFSPVKHGVSGVLLFAFNLVISWDWSMSSSSLSDSINVKDKCYTGKGKTGYPRSAGVKTLHKERIVCNVSAEDTKLGRSESSLKLSHILFK